ncbi:MAG: PIN domain-containing protein [Polaromonas sp.]
MALKQALMEQMMPLLEARILPFDNKAAEAFAQINANAQANGNPIGFADCAIASIARAHGFMAATRNVRDFKDTGVEIFDPWTFESSN